MTLGQYMAALDEAVREFKERLVDHLWEDGLPLEEINDELMLEIYERTQDSRRA